MNGGVAIIIIIIPTCPFYLLKENISSKEINSLIDYGLTKTPTIIGYDVFE